MLSKDKPGFFQTVTFRLSLLHLFVFMALIILLLVYVDFTLRSVLKQRMDTWVVDRINKHEYYDEENLFKNDRDGAIKRMHDMIRWEANIEGEDAVFYLLLSEDAKEVIAHSEYTAFQSLQYTNLYIPSSDGMKQFNGTGDAPESLLLKQTRLKRPIALQTKALPGSPHSVRLGTLQFENGLILVIGKSFSDDDHFIASIRAVFAAGFLFTVLIGCTAGYAIARKAMSGVQRVTQTARCVSEGDLNQRVPIGKEGLEIEELTHVFNHMLERIQESIETVKDFSNNIAHDLRSPLTRIRGLCETTLRPGTEQNEFEDTLEAVIDECDRLVDTINILLQIAEAESGAPAQTETVDLTELMQSACDLFTYAAEEKSIEIQLDTDEEKHIMKGNKVYLQRAVSNLIDNAIKYTPKGGQVRLSLRKVNSRIEIQIADSGSGIPGTDIPKLFDRFFRGDTSRSTQGNGLGLPYAQIIIRSHGGDISVQSEPDKGSVFTVWFPCEHGSA